MRIKESKRKFSFEFWKRYLLSMGLIILLGLQGNALGQTTPSFGYQQTYREYESSEQFKSLRFIEGIPNLMMVVEQGKAQYIFVNETSSSFTDFPNSSLADLSWVRNGFNKFHGFWSQGFFNFYAVKVGSIYSSFQRFGLIIDGENFSIIEDSETSPSNQQNGGTSSGIKEVEASEFPLGSGFTFLKIKRSSRKTNSINFYLEDKTILLHYGGNGNQNNFEILKSSSETLEVIEALLIKSLVFLTFERKSSNKVYQQIRELTLRSQNIVFQEEISENFKQAVYISNDEYYLLFEAPNNQVISLNKYLKSEQKFQVINSEVARFQYTSVIRILQKFWAYRSLFMLVEQDGKTLIKFMDWVNNVEGFMISEKHTILVEERATTINYDEMSYQLETGLLGISYTFDSDLSNKIKVYKLNFCYSDEENDQQSICIECEGPLKQDCSLCSNGFYLTQSGDCVSVCPSGSYRVDSELKCRSCSQSNCSACSSDKCSSCKEGYFLDEATDQCKKCGDSCLTCKNESECWTCSSNSILDLEDKTCKDCIQKNCNQCGKGYCQICQSGFGVQGGDCKVCPSGCEECTFGSSNLSIETPICSKCRAPYLRSQEGTCLKSLDDNCEVCGEGYCQKCEQSYFRSSGGVGEVENLADSESYCQPCRSDCLECDSNGCTSCGVGLVLNDDLQCRLCPQSNCSTCLSSTSCKICESGHFLDNGNCSKCSERCLTCDSFDSCLSCKSPYLLNTHTPSSSSCETCLIENCSECLGTSCKVCLPQFYLSFENSSEGECLTCKNIDESCIECEQGKCLKCSSPYHLNTHPLSTQICRTCPQLHCLVCASDGTCQKCDPNTYKDSLTGECIKCSEKCQKCDKNGCYQCEEDAIMRPDHTCSLCVQASCEECSPLVGQSIGQGEQGEQICLKCQKGFYLEGNICKACGKNCEECSSQNECSKCKEGYSGKGNPDFPFRDIGGVGDVCIPQNCGSYYCKACSSSGISCTLCSEGLYLNTAINGVNQCQPCPNNCRKCSGPSKCEQCFQGYSQDSEGQCIKNTCSNTECQLCAPQSGSTSDHSCLSCSEGFFKDQSTTCSKCPEGCQTCSGDSCLSCQTGYPFLHEGKCLQCIDTNCEKCGPGFCTKCESNSFFQNGRCLNCSSNCEICDENGCQKCQSGFYLDNLSLTCQKCEVDRCDDCSSDIQKCEICEAGYSKNSMATTSTSIIQCEKCKILNCKICPKISEFEKQEKCTECSEGYFKIGNSRCETCPDQNCSQCSGLECSICDDGFFRKNGICQKCQENCKKCNQYGCLDCISPYLLDSDLKCKKCLEKDCEVCDFGECKKCKNSFFLENQSCKKCDQECSECDINGCLTCASNYYNVGIVNSQVKCSMCQDSKCTECLEGKCQKCEEGYFKSNNSCIRCGDGCQECGASGCEKCEEGFQKLSSGQCTDKSCIVANCDSCDQNNPEKCKKCSNRYFLASSHLDCIPCSSGCSKCGIYGCEDGPSDEETSTNPNGEATTGDDGDNEGEQSEESENPILGLVRAGFQIRNAKLMNCYLLEVEFGFSTQVDTTTSNTESQEADLVFKKKIN